jgi:hypothetical protein
MPELSRFYGIIIRMYYDDHAPPHFHAAYGGHDLEVTINPISIRSGTGPMRVRSLVLEWAALHQQELLDAWNACSNGTPPHTIEPLD